MLLGLHEGSTDSEGPQLEVSVIFVTCQMIVDEVDADETHQLVSP